MDACGDRRRTRYQNGKPRKYSNKTDGIRKSLPFRNPQVPRRGRFPEP